MTNLIHFFLIICLTTKAWSLVNDGSPCNSERGGVGICVKTEECDPHTGAFAQDGANIIDTRKERNPIVCPAPLTCCLPTAPTVSLPMRAQAFAADVSATSQRPSCGFLQPGEGEARPGLAKLNEVPWTVGIFKPQGMKDGNRVMLFITNGALIHERAVLSVAHSLPDEGDLFAAVGDYDHLNPGRRKALRVQEQIPHNSFNRSTAEYDYALLILVASAVESMPQVAPVCLPPAGYQVPDSTRCFFTGWGTGTLAEYLSTLTKTEVPILSKDACATQLRPYLGQFYSVQPTLMCAGGEKGTDLCQGGGGSPLVCPVVGQPGRYQLAGLVVYVSSCGANGLPAVFSDVSLIRPWIEERLGAKALTLPS